MRRLVDRAIGRDMVLAAGLQVDGNFDLAEVEALAGQFQLARLRQQVLLVHVAQVEAVHLGRHARAVGIPVQQVEGEGLLAERSEEHTSELQSLMRISYAVFCLKQKKQHTTNNHNTQSSSSD